ncbi:monovalent cation/H+ antiporter complex subunit F [Rhodocista pekingensis]|uniref:Monovalent cation/H+ antiporter complex subunit F n=1 Tax=Rhodocista pekingensis TaxID=201185 RepID=A0ABW2KWA4_9PROT
MNLDLMPPGIGTMTPFLALCVDLGMLVMLVSFVLCVVRLLRGPTLPDRIVALDLFGLLAVAFIALYALWDGKAVFVDAAIALALVAFFGTVAYARFVEQLGGRLRPGSGGPAAADPQPEGKGASHDRA